MNNDLKYCLIADIDALLFELNSCWELMRKLFKLVRAHVGRPIVGDVTDELRGVLGSGSDSANEQSADHKRALPRQHPAVAYRKTLGAYRKEDAKSENRTLRFLRKGHVGWSEFSRRRGKPPMRGFLAAFTISTALLFLGNTALAGPIILDEQTHSTVTLPTDDVVGGSLVLCEGPVDAQGHCTNLNPGFSDAVHFGFFGPFAVLRSDSFNEPRDILTGQPDSPADKLGFIGPHCFFSLCKMVAETADANGQETIVYTPSAGEPGFSPSTPLTYIITSDPANLPPVPEPSTLALGLTGMLPFAFGYLKRRGVKKRQLKL